MSVGAGSGWIKPVCFAITIDTNQPNAKIIDKLIDDGLELAVVLLRGRNIDAKSIDCLKSRGGIRGKLSCVLSKYRE
jgi:hypothetical protein